RRCSLPRSAFVHFVPELPSQLFTHPANDRKRKGRDGHQDRPGIPLPTLSVPQVNAFAALVLRKRSTSVPPSMRNTRLQKATLPSSGPPLAGSDVTGTALPSSSTHIVTLASASPIGDDTLVHSAHSALTLIKRSAGVEVLNCADRRVTSCWGLTTSMSEAATWILSAGNWLWAWACGTTRPSPAIASARVNMRPTKCFMCLSPFCDVD